jgi:putative ABC transport system permease protein
LAWTITTTTAAGSPSCSSTGTAGVLLGYIAVSAANSLVMGTSQRARELAALSVGLTGTPLPYVPPLAGAALLAGVAALGMTAILIPTRLALRANPAHTIAVPE